MRQLLIIAAIFSAFAANSQTTTTSRELYVSGAVGNGIQKASYEFSKDVKTGVETVKVCKSVGGEIGETFMGIGADMKAGYRDCEITKTTPRERIEKERIEKEPKEKPVIEKEPKEPRERPSKD